MTRFKIIMLIITGLTGFSFFCKENPEKKEIDTKVFCKGEVTESMNSNGYTYVLVKTDFSKYVWVAVPETTIKKGDQVVVPHGSIMEDFFSKTLNKTFKSILFVNRLFLEGQENTAAGSPHNVSGEDYCPPKSAEVNSEKIYVKKAKGGYSVKDCYSKKDRLAGKSVTVRGKVVKYTENVMERNWIHIKDGSAKDEKGELTVTTTDRTSLGKTIVVSGNLVLNKDIGAGYRFPVLIEDAKVTEEVTEE